MARRGASRPSAAGTRVTSVGQSATWVAQQKNLRRIFDLKFITSTPERQALCKKLPPSFDNVSADESTNRELYQQWAGAFLPVLLLRQRVRGAMCGRCVVCGRALCLQLTSPHMVAGFLANEYQPDSGKGKDKFLKWQVAENYVVFAENYYLPAGARLASADSLCDTSPSLAPGRMRSKRRSSCESWLSWLFRSLCHGPCHSIQEWMSRRDGTKLHASSQRHQKSLCSPPGPACRAPWWWSLSRVLAARG